MKNVKCVRPRKVNNVIREFVESVIDYSAVVYICTMEDTSVNFAVDGDLDEAEEEEILLFVPNWKIANYADDIGGKLFRKDFVERCSIGKGFSDVTISLLHEIGHTMTKSYLPDDYDRKSECAHIDEIQDSEKRCCAYFKMLDEVLATDWAIEWLNNAENRKFAKKFEKQFWSCFK